tara:strand:+ start:23559 stop:24140 length:582 start_codon:yes stop_codon:yes gene_type:complete
MLSNLQFKFLVAFGSNVSDDINESFRIVNLALSELNNKSIKIDSISKYYQTPAFPTGAGPDFVNCAALGKTTAAPDELLTMFHAIEANLGRKRVQRWGQRSVDIDLIFYEDFVKPDLKTFQNWVDLPLADQMTETPEQLLLPHPRVQDRAFVLIPLMDVAPDWNHPVLQKTVSEMCGDLPEMLRSEVRQISDA